METYQITSAVLGFLFAGLIVWLVRRDHMHGRFAVWWLGVAFLFAVLGLSPTWIDAVALRLGISYPPILVVILGIGFLVLKVIIMDIERSKSIARLERLAQRLAILEGALEREPGDGGGRQWDAAKRNGADPMAADPDRGTAPQGGASRPGPEETKDR